MAEERGPSRSAAALPRRVPGAAGLTPGQLKRGYLPAHGAAAAETEAADAEPAQDAQKPPPPAVHLPRRAPGTSPIHAPPLLRPPRLPEPLAALSADPGAGPTPADVASTAAKLVRAVPVVSASQPRPDPAVQPPAWTPVWTHPPAHDRPAPAAQEGPRPAAQTAAATKTPTVVRSDATTQPALPATPGTRTQPAPADAPRTRIQPAATAPPAGNGAAG